MTPEKQWEIVHAYRRAVRRNLAPAITCTGCRVEMVPSVGRDSGPVFKCLSCKVVETPGLNMLEEMESYL